VLKCPSCVIGILGSHFASIALMISLKQTGDDPVFHVVYSIAVEGVAIGPCHSIYRCGRIDTRASNVTGRIGDEGLSI
jgi:hypothetical protein